MSAQNNPAQPVKVIVDSNSFFIPLEFKIDIYEETKRLLTRNVEFVLLSAVKSELEMLADGKEAKLRRQASFALRLSEKCRLVTIDSKGEEVDDIIVRAAKNWDCTVLTNDIVLRRRLRDISVPVIYLRQKSRLDIDGLIL